MSTRSIAGTSSSSGNQSDQGLPTHPDVSPAKFLEDMLAMHPIVVISATYCTFCTRLKALLLDIRSKFVTLEINVLPNGRAVFEEVVCRSQCHSVPQVFVRGEYIGGYDDILTLHHKGELLDLLGDGKK